MCLFQDDPENDIKSKSLEKYIVDSNIMKLTHADSVFMHCLPAKVGLEVTDDVFRVEVHCMETGI